MTGPRPSRTSHWRTDTLLRAREFIRAHGQVPRTGDMSGNPGEAAWQLLEQVLDVAEAERREVRRAAPDRVHYR